MRRAGRPADVVLPVGEAQYLVDEQLIKALRSHPLRTHDAEAATLHVIGAVPYASEVLGRAEGNLPAHQDRMVGLARALRSNPHFSRRTKPFLFVYPSFTVTHMGLELLSALGAGLTVVATSDPKFSRDFGNYYTSVRPQAPTPSPARAQSQP